MINLSNSELYRLIPINLRDDEDIKAAAQAVDQSTKNINTSAEKLDFRSNPLIKDNEVLDALAVDMHVDFYDKNLSPQFKREIIDNSLILHMEKGTGGAVERALASIGIKGQVVEWYEYAGTPYTFKIILEPPIDLVTGNISKIINSYKRESAHFDFFEIKVMDVFAIVRTKQYTFPVPYPVTGTFRTAPINGIASKATAAAESKIYANPVHYPVTGTFVARDEPFVRLEGKAEDLRLERVDLWENRNLLKDSNAVNDLTNNSILYPVKRTYMGGHYRYEPADQSSTGGINLYNVLGPQVLAGASVIKGSVLTGSVNLRTDRPGLKANLRFVAYKLTTRESITMQSELIHLPVGEWIRMEIDNSSLPIPFNIGQGDALRLMVSLYDITPPAGLSDMRGHHLDIRRYQIQEGVVSTPWQPAPEDGITWYQPETVKLIEIDLYKSGLYLNSKFTWLEDTPPGTTAIVEFSFDTNTWSKLENGGSLPLEKYASLVGKKLCIRKVLTTIDQRITPVIRNFKYVINDKEAIV